MKSITRRDPHLGLSAFLLASIVLLLVGAGRVDPDLGVAEPKARVAPEFTQSDPASWINTAPLTLDQLRGQVVLIDFWTFECWNCYRSFPWLNQVDQRYAAQGLQIVGVHSPEFEHEKALSRVQAKVREFELEHAVMIDNDFAYWRAMKNRFWPAFYLIDKHGRIRATYIGETHIGDKQAREIEAKIDQLLAEPA